ncbi:hypothetical protein MAH1_21890 [Sessilibacter sp. MAH1]
MSITSVCARKPFQLSLIAACIISANSMAFAQTDNETSSKNIKTTVSSDIETVLVIADQNRTQKIASETQHFLSSDQVDSIRGITSGDLIARLPSANITTNSRGETLVNVRSAGERQLSVFFNGALVNVPWDNRYDLDLFPANLIDSVATATGTLSPQYGVNALSAVSIQPKTQLKNSNNFQVDGQFGSENQRGVDVVGSIRRGDHDFILGIGNYERDGLSLSSDESLEFHQRDDDQRTNTDYERDNAFFHYGYEQDTWNVSTSIIYSNIERGIAPESDRPADDVRFWRYPKADTFMAVVSGSALINANSEITATTWMQNYQQTINSYTDETYSLINAVQEDDDNTFGARVIYSYHLNKALVNVSGNYVHSEHQQKDTDFDELGIAIADSVSDQNYSQDLISAGLDFKTDLTNQLTLELGAGIDSVNYIDTGELPGIDSFNEPVLRAGLNWQATDELTLRLAVGEKSRVPTMRELFGTALNRFLINPDLEPEKVFSTELGFDWFTGPHFLSVTLFDQQLDDTIDQQRVGRLRQRINLKGSQVTGIEVNSSWALTEQLNIIAQATLSDARRKVSSSDEPDVLSERPENLGRLKLDYAFLPNSNLYLEADYRGKSYSPDPDGDLQELDDATLYNIGVDWVPETLSNYTDNQLTLFMRAENITDEYYLPQSGLPAAGMSYRLGFRYSL